MTSLLASKTFLPCIGRHRVGEVALEVDRIDQRQPCRLRDGQVVLAEGRRDVDDAGALAELDEVAAEDAERALFFLSAKNGNSGS